MRKVFLAAAVFAVVGLTSCKKDYTCECTVTFLGVTTTASTTINDTKKNAEDECNKGDLAGSSECEIK